MAESKIESEKPTGNQSAFAPHRRRHLNSGTYRTLVRILSHCSDEPERSVSDQNEAQETNQDNGINESVQATEREVCVNVELVDQQVRVANERCDSDGFRERIEQIESIMSVEEDEVLLEQKYGMGIENTLPMDLQDLVFGPENALMDELEWIVKGNENSTPKPSATSLNQNLDGITLDVEPMVQEKEMELETYVSSEDEKGTFIPSTEVGPTKEPENFSEKVPESFNFSTDKEMVAEASKLTEYSKDKSSSRETDYLEVEHEMQQKAKEQENVVCTSTAMNSLDSMNDGDVEEGEISGDNGIDDQSVDVILHDTVMLKENKVNEISEDVIDGKEDSCNEANEKDLISDSVMVDMVDEGKTSRGLEFRDISETVIISRPEVVQDKNVRAVQIDDSNPVLEDGRIEIRDNGVSVGIGCPAAGNLGTIYEGKWDDGSCQKRKRGPPSKEKKERKKAKERKKRAEKERELGVKRLKLQMILKPKPVAYCRHYIRGRCHEGDKCKFSHDTEPITKSKPCVHFARQSCMKGDDCPYDHQLSKYPCNNFKESGFCIRGDRCLFSHKMLAKEDSATASKPELKSPVVQGNSKSQLVNIGGASQQNSHALAYSTGIHSGNSTKQNVTETLTKRPELAPKGISFPLISSSPAVHSSAYKQGGLTPSRNADAKAGNQIYQSPLGSVDSSNVTPVRTPPVTTPKGINFLSFGKASPKDSGGKNQVGHQTSTSVSETIQKLNGLLKANQLVALQGTSFNPFGKAPIADSTSDKLVSFPAHSDSGSSRNYLQSLNAADKPESSSTISLRQTPTSLAGQSSVGIASRFCKDPANSSHRGLFSTLAFAAKYTAQRMNDSTGSTGTLVDKETRNSSSLQNDSAKPL